MASPTVVTPQGDLENTEGDVVSIDIRGNFDDADIGNFITWTIESGLPGSTGISISPTTGEILGVPTQADVDASPYTIVVRAEDEAAEAIEFPLTLNFADSGGVIPNPDEPLPPNSRGILLIWYNQVTNNPALSLDAVKGGQVYAELSQLYDNANFTSPSTSALTGDLTGVDTATGGPKYFTFQVGGQKDVTMRERMWYLPGARTPTYNAKNAELDGDWIGAFWDSTGDGLNLLNDIQDAAFDLYDTVLTAGQRSRCLGIRISMNAVGSEHDLSQEPNAAVKDTANYVKGSSANATRPADWTEALADVATEATLEYAFDRAFPDGAAGAAAYPILFRPNRYDNYSAGFKTKLDTAWHSNKMGVFITSYNEEPHNNGHETSYIKFRSICVDNLNTKGLAEGYGAKPGDQFPGARFTYLQRKYWGNLCMLHVGATNIYYRDERAILYGTGSENALEYKAAMDFTNKYAGWHAAPSSAPGAWLALREGNRLEGNYAQHMTQITTGAAVRGSELYAGTTAIPSTDWVGRPSAATADNKTDQGIGQRQSLWAFEFAATQRLKVALDTDFATSIDGGQITVNIHYLDEGASRSFTPTIFGVGYPAVTLVNSRDWKIHQIVIPACTVAVDGDGAHVSILTNTAAIAYHMIEVSRG